MIRTILILLFPVFAFGQQGMLLVGEAAAAPAGLLLDTYTGAAAAFATMKLRADADSCMVIRRSSDNATQLIGFSGDDIDESTISTHCSGTDCFVVRWCDQTGQGLDAVQTTAGKQPKVYDSSTGIVYQNSLVAVDFDGQNDHLQTATFSTTSKPATAWVVWSWDALTGYPYVIDMGKQDGIIYHYSNALRSHAGTDLTWGPISTATQYLAYAHFANNTTDSEIAINGGTAVTGNAGTNTHDQFTIGSERDASALTFTNGRIQAVIIYHSDQRSNRTAIETAINNYYSIY